MTNYELVQHVHAAIVYARRRGHTEPNCGTMWAIEEYVHGQGLTEPDAHAVIDRAFYAFYGS